MTTTLLSQAASPKAPQISEAVTTGPVSAPASLWSRPLACLFFGCNRFFHSPHPYSRAFRVYSQPNFFANRAQFCTNEKSPHLPAFQNWLPSATGTSGRVRFFAPSTKAPSVASYRLPGVGHYPAPQRPCILCFFQKPCPVLHKRKLTPPAQPSHNPHKTQPLINIRLRSAKPLNLAPQLSFP